MTVSDGTESAAPIAPETPASNPAPEADPTTNLNTLEESPAKALDQAPPEVEYDEVEVDGQKYQIPKPAKKGFMQEADYTRKSQRLAEREKQLAQFANLTLDEQRTMGRIAIIDEEITALFGKEMTLEDIGRIDWKLWAVQDRAAAERAAKRVPKLLNDRRQHEALIRQHGTQRTQRQQQETAERLSATIEYAKEHITGWNRELADQLEEYAAREFEIAGPEFEAWVNPKNLRALHKAWLADKSSQQQQQPTKDAPKAPAIAPLTVVGSRSSPGAKRPLAAVDDMEEYVRRRRAGEKG